MAEVRRTRARKTMYMSARVVEEGEDVDVAARSSMIRSRMVGRSVTKVSVPQARISTAIRRRLSWVLRSASNLAEVAPTPKTMPAVVGGVIRLSISVIRSLSVIVHSFNRGNQSLCTKETDDPKNLESLKASPISFFQVFWLPESLVSSWRRVNVVFEIVSGKAFERIEGPITFVEMAPAAVKTRSDSTRILGRLGTMLDNTPTTSSALSVGDINRCSLGLDLSDCEADTPSVKDVGLVVKRAVSNRKNRSY